MEENSIKPLKDGEKTVERNPDGTIKSGVLNPDGYRKGQKNFSTLFEKAIKKIAESQNTDDTEIEVDLVLKAIAEAKKGKFSYHKDIFDRVYGQAEQKHEVRGELKIGFYPVFEDRYVSTRTTKENSKESKEV
jgi:hypothetical protein